MKTTFIRKSLAIVLVFLSSIAMLNAQKSGVYKTYADYKNNRLSYEIDCATQKHKIRLNDFIGRDYITVIHEGVRYKLKKAEIWGYQLCKDNLVRFYGKEHFPLLDKGILWIYSKERMQGVGGPKSGSRIVTTYYFSMGGDGKIVPLTLSNVKAAFPDNHKLHDAISDHFKTDESLGSMDSFHKKTEINHFLEMQNAE